MRFSWIIGQDRVKDFFRRVITEDRIPHAYLFTGISGVGKTSTAVALTMALNCRQPTGIEACGVCPSCRQMAGGNFPDFISVQPEGQNIKIEQMREINRRLSFAPVSARYRVCVIHQAEAMTTEAANCFLKTLEEPPGGNILVLNAVEPRNLLPTIVSRCQRVPFQPLPVDAMTQWLVEEKGVEPKLAAIAARASDGSLKRALEITEAGFSEKRKIWMSHLLKLPAISKGDALAFAMDAAVKEKEKKSEPGAAEEPGLLELLAMWGSWFRDVLIVKVGAPDRLITNLDLREQLKAAARSVAVETLTASLLAVDQAARDLHRMGNPQLVMGHTVLELQRLCTRPV